MNKKVKELMGEHKLPDGTQIMYGLEIERIAEEYSKDLQHHKDTTVGLWALDRDPKKLLHEFWQRSSDACPLECGEAEKQEKEFEAFVENLCFQI
mgnify:FL=1